MGDTRIGGSPVPQPHPDSVDNSEMHVGPASSISDTSGQTPVQMDAVPQTNPAATKALGSELKSELNMTGDLIKNSLQRQLADGWQPRGPIVDHVGHSREPIPYTRPEDLRHDIDSGMA